MCFFFSLKELGDFIKTTDNGLTKPVDEGDYNGLVECMGYLFAVKERQATTDEMFEPLKQTIELLKTYEQEMPEEVHLQLQVKAMDKSLWLLSTLNCYHPLARDIVKVVFVAGSNICSYANGS